MSNEELPDWLVERVRRDPPDDLRPSVVPGSTPVVCFGDQRVAEVATLGINPSWLEFCRSDGTLLPESERRLPTLASLGAERLSDLSDAQVLEHLRGCYGYFDRNPLWKWFGYLGSANDRLAAEKSGVKLPNAGPHGSVLDVAGASYLQRTACHLDLVQWATKPVWSGLDPQVRSTMLADDAPFLINQLQWDRRLPHGRLQLVLVNGRGAQEQCEQVGVTWTRTEDLVAGGRETHFWTAEWHGVPLVAWSANLQHRFTPPALLEAVPGHLQRVLSDMRWQRREPRAVVIPTMRPTLEQADRVIFAVPPGAAGVLATLEAQEARFNVDVFPDRLELRDPSSTEPAVVVHQPGLSLALTPGEAQSLLRVVPGRLWKASPEEHWVLIREDTLRVRELQGIVTVFAHHALVPAERGEPDEPLAADELVEAITESARFKDHPADMADYWRRRRDVLTDLLTVGLELPVADPDRPWRSPEQDQALLLDLLQDAAKVRLESMSPLRDWVEAPEVFLEIDGLQAHNEAFGALTKSRDEQLHSFMLDVLERAYPGITSRHTSVRELVARGVPAHPPRGAMQLAMDGDWGP